MEPKEGNLEPKEGNKNKNSHSSCLRSDINGNVKIDLSGLSTPITIIRVRIFLKIIKAGKILTIISTDPDMPRDLLALVKAKGHILLESTTSNGKNIFRVLVVSDFQ